MYFGDHTTSDMAFDVDGRSFHCHKSVLCARSPFLADFFRSDPTCGRVRISNATTEAFGALLTSFYDAPAFVGQLSAMPLRHVLSCWEISLRFEIQTVSGQCVAVLHRGLTQETAAAVVTACEKHIATSAMARELQVHAQSLLSSPPLIVHQSPHPVVPIFTQRPPMYKVNHSDLVVTPTASPSVSQQMLQPPNASHRDPLSRQPSDTNTLVEMCANVGTAGSQVRQRYLEYLRLYNRQRQYLEQQVGVVRDLEATSDDDTDGVRLLRMTHTRLVHDVRALENEMYHFRAECEDTTADAHARRVSQDAEEKAVVDHIAHERHGLLQTALGRAREAVMKELEKDLEEQKTRYQVEMRMWAKEKAQLLEEQGRGVQDGQIVLSLAEELKALQSEEASLKLAKEKIIKETEDNQKYDSYTRQYVRAAGVARQEITTLLDEGKDFRVSFAAYQQMRKRVGSEVANSEGRVAWLTGKVAAEVEAVKTLRQGMVAAQATKA